MSMMLTERARRRRILDELARNLSELETAPADDVRRFLCWLALFHTPANERQAVIADVLAELEKY